MLTDADKTWTKIKKAFKATFTPYDAAAQAQVALTSLNQDWQNPLGFDKYNFSFSLLSVRSGTTDYRALLEWFLQGLDPQIAVQLTLLGVVKPPPLWRNFTQRPLRSREATTASHHLEEDPNHPMEEVVVTTTPMPWTWIASCYPQASKLAICTKLLLHMP